MLIVDPIDGTRPAMAGSSRPASRSPPPLLRGRADDGRRRGRLRGRDQDRGDASWRSAAAGVEPGAALSHDRRASSGCSGPTASAAGRWSPTAIVLEELIDASSVGGGTFDLGSATFDMTRLVTGQLDAYVEPGPRMIDEVDWDARRVRAGRPRRGPQQLPLRPRRRGADLRGGRRGGHRRRPASPLGERPLLGSGHEFQMSCVCAANAELHAAIIASLDRGIERLRAEGPRHA